MRKITITVMIALTALFIGVMSGILIDRVVLQHSYSFSGSLEHTAEHSNTTSVPNDIFPEESQSDALLATSPVDMLNSIKINVNTASKEDLMLLPGIGEKLAQAIIQYRTEYGQFKETNDLLNVPGIGAKRLNAILNYITVGG